MTRLTLRWIGTRGRCTQLCCALTRVHRPAWSVAPPGTRGFGLNHLPHERAQALPCSAVETVLGVTMVLISVILIFLVLLHSGKDAGLSGAFGIGSGGGSFGGGSLVERNLDRWTIFFAILFVVNTVVLLKY